MKRKVHCEYRITTDEDGELETVAITRGAEELDLYRDVEYDDSGISVFEIVVAVGLFCICFAVAYGIWR